MNCPFKCSLKEASFSICKIVLIIAFAVKYDQGIFLTVSLVCFPSKPDSDFCDFPEIQLFKSVQPNATKVERFALARGPVRRKQLVHASKALINTGLICHIIFFSNQAKHDVYILLNRP